MGDSSDPKHIKCYPGRNHLVAWSLITLNFSQFGWRHLFENRADTWFIMLNALMGVMASLTVFLMVSNWRGWGRWLAELGPGAPRYTQPRSTFADILLFVAPLLVVANLILLVLVLFRW